MRFLLDNEREKKRERERERERKINKVFITVF